MKKSWKTTSAGILSIVAGVTMYIADRSKLIESLTLVLTGVGLLFARDYDVPNTY